MKKAVFNSGTGRFEDAVTGRAVVDTEVWPALNTGYIRDGIRAKLDSDDRAALEAATLLRAGKQFQFIFTSRGSAPYDVRVVEISDAGDGNDLQLARNRLEALHDWNYRLTLGQAEALRQDYLALRNLALPMPVMEDDTGPSIDDLKHSGVVSSDPNEKKAKPSGSSPALRIACPVDRCKAVAGAYCQKQDGSRQVVAHKKRRELEERTR